MHAQELSWNKGSGRTLRPLCRRTRCLSHSKTLTPDTPRRPAPAWHLVEEEMAKMDTLKREEAVFILSRNSKICSIRLDGPSGPRYDDATRSD